MGCAIPPGIDSHSKRQGNSPQLFDDQIMKLRTEVTVFAVLRTEFRTAVLFLDLTMKLPLLAMVVFALTGLALPLPGQDTTAAAPDTAYVDYHESPISLPLGLGLRIPAYD